MELPRPGAVLERRLAGGETHGYAVTLHKGELLRVSIGQDARAPGSPGSSRRAAGTLYRLRLEATPAQGHTASEVPFRVERR